MGLGDFFRPKWRHSNAEVRLEAVKGLDESEALKAVATGDSDPAVRKVAVKKLGELAVLELVASSDGDASVRKLAQERVNALLVREVLGGEAAGRTALAKLSDARALADVIKQATDESIWRPALEKLDDPRLLADVVRGTGSAEVRLAALEGVSDPAALRGIAVDEERKEIAIAALERIDEPEWLQEIAKKAKNKAVRSRAKRRLALLTEPDPEQKAEELAAKKRRAQQTQLCQMVEAAGRDRDLAAGAEAVAEAQQAWEALGPEGIDAELKERFTQSCQRFFERQQAQVELLRQQQHEAERRRHEKAIATAEAEALREQEAASEMIEREQAEAERRRRDEEDQQQLATLVSEAESLTELSLKEASSRLEAIQRQTRRLGRTLQRNPEQAARLESVEKGIQQRQAAFAAEQERALEDNLARVERVLDALEQLKESPQRRDVEKGLTDAQQVFRKMGSLPARVLRNDLRARYEQLRKDIFIHLQELREADEWKRWSNVGQKEELCRRVEALKGEKDLKLVAKQLRDFQAQWKKAGPVSRERADDLWIRFKTACDLAYERCKGYFEQLEQERGENLGRKEELCTRVEALADSEDWEAAAEEIKALQVEWRGIGAVPREQSDEIWKRFRSACDGFFERRKEHYDELNEERKENLKRKEELCEEVEGLVDSEEWQATADKIKALQSMWKKIGPVPRKKSDATWKRFRSACDRFFERREEAREEQRFGALKERQELCAELERFATELGSGSTPAEAAPPAEAANDEALGVVDVDENVAMGGGEGAAEPAGQGSEPGAKALELVLAARERWKRMGRVPRSKELQIGERFQTACGAVVLALPAAFAGSELDVEVSARRRERICQRLEKLLEQAPAARGSASAGASAAGGAGVLDPEQAAEQLREALAANALGTACDSGWSWNETDAEMEELRRAWLTVGPVPGEANAEFEQRFRALWQALDERRPREQAEERESSNDSGARRKGRRRRPRGEGDRAGAPASVEAARSSDSGAVAASEPVEGSTGPATDAPASDVSPRPSTLADADALEGTPAL